MDTQQYVVLVNCMEPWSAAMLEVAAYPPSHFTWILFNIII